MPGGFGAGRGSRRLSGLVKTLFPKPKENRMKRLFLIIALSLVSAPAIAEGDVVNGADVFKR